MDETKNTIFSRKGINEWLRYFANFNPLIDKFVKSAVEAIIDDKLKNMFKEHNALSLLYDIAREYILLGEMFMANTGDKDEDIWNNVELLMPENINVPDRYTKEYSVHFLNNNIKLDPNKLYFLMRQDNANNLRGTSVLYSELKNLLDEDDLRKKCYENPDDEESKKLVNELHSKIEGSLKEKLELINSKEYVNVIRKQIMELFEGE